MKNFIVLAPIFFSTLTYGEDIPTHELFTVAGFAIQNISLFEPQLPHFEEPIKPTDMGMAEGTYQLLLEEKIKGDSAYFILLAIVSSGSEVINAFREKIRNDMEKFELDADKKTQILEYLNGRAVPPPTPPNERDTIGPREAFDKVIAGIAGLPSFFPGKEKLKNAMIFSRNMIMGSEEGCYGNDPGCVYGSNQGLRQYLTNLVSSDQKLFLDAFRFYARLREYQKTHPHTGDFSVFDKNVEADQLPLVMSAVGGDVYQGIRVLTLFTHDQCCSGLSFVGPLKNFILALNEISPTYSHSDTPESILHAPGALGGITIPEHIRNRFAELKIRHKELYHQDIEFGSGYYHVYGGLLTGSELIRNGYANINGVKFSTFLSQTLGYYYKKYTLTLWLTKDALVLWHQVGENENLRPEKPDGWPEKRFQEALLNLDELLAYLEHTTEQHRQGAELAYKLFMQAGGAREVEQTAP